MWRLLFLAVLALPGAARAAAAPPAPVRVYVLAGQSNMEGKARLSLMDYQARQPATRGRFAHLRRGDRWAVFDSVWIKFLDRKGRLTAGFGSPGCVGPELEFGATVARACPGPVLLIKTAWGGRSLYRDFRPPSAGLPPAAVLGRMLAEERKRRPGATAGEVEARFGESYRRMIGEVNGTRARLGEGFPELAGRRTELAGFVWFQGWNDMIDPAATAEYAANLAHLIRDVRKDLRAPRLPVVVAQMGVGGARPDEAVRRFKAAQMAVMKDRAFRGNVEVVRTDEFWDAEADAVFRKGWRKHREEWDRLGSDYPYHYLGSPWTYCRIGRALAEAALRLGRGR